MPNIESAKKRMRQNQVLRRRNRADRSALRTAIKRVRAAVEAKNAEEATQALNESLSVIGKASSKGLLHKNAAARQVSRLTLAVNGLSKSS